MVPTKLNRPQTVSHIAQSHTLVTYTRSHFTQHIVPYARPQLCVSHIIIYWRLILFFFLKKKHPILSLYCRLVQISIPLWLCIAPLAFVSVTRRIVYTLSFILLRFYLLNSLYTLNIGCAELPQLTTEYYISHAQRSSRNQYQFRNVTSKTFWMRLNRSTRNILRL